ncbi:hypothetical protein E4H12_08675 [Candidatus Thorarchaeota archaeon]|nr:MAG: hypothetical protein E4H12_08675 [Candidatus Thorarchaeota archaeon]
MGVTKSHSAAERAHLRRYDIAQVEHLHYREKAVASKPLSSQKRKDAFGVKCKWLNPVAARQYRLPKAASWRELT